MPDLFSDLQSSGGGDYFYALDSAPGGLAPEKATLTVSGLAPSIFEQTTAFRTPATITLTLNGLSLSPEIPLSPTTAVLTLSGQIPDEYRERIITPALPEPSYEVPQALTPTILFINTVTPDPAQISISNLTLNVSPGGDIAFISPGVGSINFAYGPVTLIFYPVEVGQLSLVGLEPTLLTERILGTEEDAFEAGQLTIVGLAPTVELPFTWIDVDPQPPTTWTTTTGAAA